VKILFPNELFGAAAAAAAYLRNHERAIFEPGFVQEFKGKNFRL